MVFVWVIDIVVKWALILRAVQLIFSCGLFKESLTISQCLQIFKRDSGCLEIVEMALKKASFAANRTAKRSAALVDMRKH